jgi:hypothetical protein
MFGEGEALREKSQVTRSRAWQRGLHVCLNIGRGHEAIPCEYLSSQYMDIAALSFQALMRLQVHNVEDAQTYKASRHDCADAISLRCVHMESVV